jgi:GxxExxY protein
MARCGVRSIGNIMSQEIIVKQIVGAAMKVLNELKPGLDEKLYERALVIELSQRGHIVHQQPEYAVHYCGQLIGKMAPDLIVDGIIITELKVVSVFNETHVAQMLGYLSITKLELAILLNFKESTLSWRRIVRRRDLGGGRMETV